jgi:hypothetical protein
MSVGDKLKYLFCRYEFKVFSNFFVRIAAKKISFQSKFFEINIRTSTIENIPNAKPPSLIKVRGV